MYSCPLASFLTSVGYSLCCASFRMAISPVFASIVPVTELPTASIALYSNSI